MRIRYFASIQLVQHLADSMPILAKDEMKNHIQNRESSVQTCTVKLFR